MTTSRDNSVDQQVRAEASHPCVWDIESSCLSLEELGDSIRRNRTDEALRKSIVLGFLQLPYVDVDIDLTICRHATTRGDRALDTRREAWSRATEQVFWWSS